MLRRDWNNECQYERRVPPIRHRQQAVFPAATASGTLVTLLDRMLGPRTPRVDLVLPGRISYSEKGYVRYVERGSSRCRPAPPALSCVSTVPPANTQMSIESSVSCVRRTRLPRL
jgi:hypothetical protein